MKKLYYNGDFITLENKNVQAILIEDNIIKKVGTLEDLRQYKDNDTQIYDLQGKTMMPSFIDAHSHFSGVANHFLKVNLEGCTSFSKIQEKLLQYKKEKSIPDNEWIIAEGYDHNTLEEKEHPTKECIEQVLPNNPVVLQHKSGHMGVFNSKALTMLDVTENTKQIEGGKIEKQDGKLTGYMEENAFIYYIKKIPMPNLQDLMKAYEKAQQYYASYGITTIQDGMMYANMIPIYKKLIEENILQLDVVSYIPPQERDVFFQQAKERIKKYKNHWKIGGYKIFLDGSPQAKTAWMRTPYQGDESYFGVSTMKDEEVDKDIQIAKETSMQILAHCNGDGAAQQLIESIKRNSKNIEKIRPVMIHAQLLGIDQIKEMKPYGIIPSFFIAHVYHWGDVHIKNFGYERASTISPAKTAWKENKIFTFHQDAPVIAPNMFETIWCAVNRITKEGKILGEKEKISVLEAIKAVTIHSAYQYFEEGRKGSIKEGKLANLIIVQKNPLKVSLEELKNIQVLETIQEGKTIFKRE